MAWCIACRCAQRWRSVLSHENVENEGNDLEPNAKQRSYKTWLVLLVVWGGVALLVGLNMN